MQEEINKSTRIKSTQHIDSQEARYDKHERFFISQLEVSERASKVNEGKSQNQ